MKASVAQVLAWRLERHFLRSGTDSPTRVVKRLCAVPTGSGDADLSIRRRLASPGPDVLDHAVGAGDLICTYAFRGAAHLLAAEDAGAYMAVRAARRQWELPSWQSHYRLGTHDWAGLREIVRDAVADGPISRSELADAVATHRRFRHLRSTLLHPSHTFLKPLAWQGDVSFGPPTSGEPTYQSPESSPRWTGLPDLDEAGRLAICRYLSGYGPATRTNLHYWLSAGLSGGRRRVDGWLADVLGDRVVEIDVGGTPMLLLREHIEGLAAQPPRPDDVTMLPGHDQWVLGPGTADVLNVPTPHRPQVSRGANLVLRAGIVAGTWTVVDGSVVVSWFVKTRTPPKPLIESELDRMTALLDLT